MRILPDYNFRNIASISANNENPLFPVSNLKELDPTVIWKALDFSAPIEITADLGSPLSVNKIWLNNANFRTAILMANSSDSWEEPEMTKTITLGKDDLGVLKGYFDIGSAPFRYIKLAVPLQGLDKGDAPYLGNFIVGNDLDFSPVSKWEPDVDYAFYTFTSDGGSYFKTPKTKPRHVFGCGFEHITKSEHKALPITGWNNAIIYTDLDDVSDSYLVYPPAGRSSNVRNPIDCSIELVFEELV